MSDQSARSSGAPGNSSPAAGAPSGNATLPTPPDTRKAEPRTQEKRDWRNRWPTFAKQLPRFKFPDQPPNFQLIDPARLDTILTKADPAAKQSILEDMKFLDNELLRFFRDRDYEAAKRQNQYRLLQLGFIALAALATLIGAFQALSLNNRPDLVPFFAFLETVVALIATFLATISGREPPLPLWLNNRRRAESLRREYFRYLMNLPPYEDLSGYHKRLTLSQRAADINRGVFPDDLANS
jgi:hypothetical protein